jgi:hypothetical protein
MKSWKTTLCGAVAIAAQVSKLLLPMPLQVVASAVSGVASAIGLILAKDHR